MNTIEKLQPIEVGYADRKVIFSLRMISMAEQDLIDALFAEIKPDAPERFEREYQICRDAIAKFSVATPETYETVSGESHRVPLVPKAGTPEIAVNEAFEDRSLRNERIIRTAYVSFQKAMAPDSRFLVIPTDSQGSSVSSEAPAV